MRWTIRWGYSRTYNAILGTITANNVFDTSMAAPATAPTEQNIIFETSTPGVAFVQIESSCRLDFSDCQTGDILWVSLERTGSLDSYNSNIDIINITLDTTEFQNGLYRTP